MLERVNPDQFSRYYGEILDGENSHMYGELLKNRAEFDDPTWEYGVNFFFVGDKIINQLMESRLLQGVEPEYYSYENALVNPSNIDEIRVREMINGRLKLPKKWEDLPRIAERARIRIGNSTKFHADLMQFLDPQTRDKIMEILTTQPTRLELFRQCKTATINQLENALQIFLDQTQLSALTRSLDIISELRKQSKVEEKLKRNHVSRLTM